MGSSLKREIGLFEAIGFGVGIILGAGIYALIGPAAEMAGNALWMSFVLGAIISSFTGLSYAELSTMFPEAAAEYVYAKKAFGKELWAFLLGWLIIFAGAVSVSTVAIGFSGYLRSFIDMPTSVTALLLIGMLSFLNFLGIEESSRVNIMFTAIEVAGLALIIFLGLGRFPNVDYLASPTGLQGIFAGAALIFFAYLGFEDIVNIAEEIEDPQKNIPRALIFSIIVATVFYVLVAVSAVSLADWRILGGSDAPLAYAASTVLGGNAFFVLSIIALFATANTVLILLMVGSRMVYGMARDGSLPKIFSIVHEERGTPWIAIVAVMLLSMLFAAIGDIRLIAGVTNFATFTIFALVNLSLLSLRYKQPDLKRPFKVPFNIGRFPVVAFLGVASCIFFVFHIDLLAVMIGFLALVGGVLMYGILNLKKIVEK